MIVCAAVHRQVVGCWYLVWELCCSYLFINTVMLNFCSVFEHFVIFFNYYLDLSSNWSVLSLNNFCFYVQEDWGVENKKKIKKDINAFE